MTVIPTALFPFAQRYNIWCMKAIPGGRGGSKEQGSLGPRVAERIKDDIFRARLLPREPLIEAELAAAHGVSKTPVREALSSLARAGLVDLDPFRGARVRDFTADDVREIYEMRVLLEPFALEKAVPRMDENDRGLLSSLLDDADAAAESQDQLRAIALRSWMLTPTYPREAEQHRRVAEAVASGDADRAADLLRDHIVGFKEQFVGAFGHGPS